MSETIFALASGGGRAGVAVIRVSGARSFESLQAFAGEKSFLPRQAVLLELRDPVSRETVDRALILKFKGPGSYTGEDVVEYHLHGSPAVIREMLAILGRQPGHRMAEPGEFTRRAFENGKMDLTEAEAVADLIHAETQLQKAQALLQMGGALSRLYEGWAEALSRILAHAEAEIEFPDEDLPVDLAQTIGPGVRNLEESIRAHLDDGRRGERLRDGVQVVVIGAPNAGKSSLVNFLAQREVAIVSEFAGTTRDILEAHLDIGGYPVILCDTAGLRPEELSEDGQGLIEAEGIRRALERAKSADIKLLVFDGALERPDPHSLAMADGHSVVVINKADIGGAFTLPGAVSLSTKTGVGVDDLLRVLQERVETMIGRDEAPALTRQRHREALELCVGCLMRSLQAGLPELMAEDLRLAIRALGRITGRVDVEDLLDIVFRDFCIGK